ncbi:MAG TPA: NADPH-dependent F420 reductase [Ferruginibacter sp.]|jgi:predicted dinucleotide-binding enzyme|nr:NADPH-dependent F420 reductase [Ferruginibacter sp.]
MKQTIGIIGAGNIAQTLAKYFINSGHQVILSNSRGKESLQEIVIKLGNNVKAGSVEEAAAADIVVLALPWSHISSIEGLSKWNNRIVIDATNHFISYAPEFKTADLGGLASTEVVASHLKGARVVKAFNTMFYEILGRDPNENGGKRVIFYSGDDKDAKKDVNVIITSFGFAAVDLGNLSFGSKLQEANGALAGLNLIKL